MVLLCKNKALYVKICVIQNGVPDAQGDVLGTKEIKQIFTSFNNQDNFEIHHNNLPISEVSLLENYISTVDEDIADTTVPKGSWNAVVRVDNPEIKQQLMDGVFGGVSLNNRINSSCSTGLVGKYHTYSDLKSAECVIPLFISFVEDPSNGVGLHIMDYDMYIQKSKSNGVKTMSFLDKVKALIQEEEAEVSIQKDATPIDTKNDSDSDVKVVEKSVDAKETTDEEKEEEEVVEKATEDEEEPKDDSATEETTETEEVVEEVKEEEEVITKECKDDDKIEKADPTEEVETEVVEEVTEEVDDAIDYEARIANLEEKVAKLEAILESKAEPTTESEEPVEPVITKSAKIEVTEQPVLKNVYELTGRDPVTGKKIRRQSKVLN